MTPSELRARIESRGTESHFFDRRTMRFFGDSMRNYGVRSATIQTLGESIVDGKYQPESVDVWELYRRRPVKSGNQASAYFNKVTFRQRYPLN